jgi:hypothetical protein
MIHAVYRRCGEQKDLVLSYPGAVLDCAESDRRAFAKWGGHLLRVASWIGQERPDTASGLPFSRESLLSGQPSPTVTNASTDPNMPPIHPPKPKPPTPIPVEPKPKRWGGGAGR